MAKKASLYGEAGPEKSLVARPGAVSREQARMAGAALHRWLPHTVGLVAASG